MKGFAFLLLFLAAPAMAQDPLPKPMPKPTVPKDIAAKAGDLIVIPVDAKGDVFFSWDENVFSAKRAIQDGKKLYLTTPYNSKTVVNVVMLEEKTQSRIIVTVTDGIDPPIVPPVVTPPDSDVASSLKALTKAVNDLQKRVAALESAKPPPVGAIAKHVTFIGAEVNQTSLAIDNDATLRMMLKGAGITVHVLKKDDPLIVSKGLATAVAKAGGAPCVIIQDETGNVIGQGQMASLQQVTDLCAQFIKR